MKLKLKKNKIKVLTQNDVTLPQAATPNVAGGRWTAIENCLFTNPYRCGESNHPNGCNPSQHVTVCT